MTTPLVKEMRLPLEPVSRDPFLQGLEEAESPSDGQSAVSCGRCAAERPSGPTTSVTSAPPSKRDLVIASLLRRADVSDRD